MAAAVRPRVQRRRITHTAVIAIAAASAVIPDNESVSTSEIAITIVAAPVSRIRLASGVESHISRSRQ